MKRRILFSLFTMLVFVGALTAGEYKPFEGEKKAWHDRFDRYDFIMDEATLSIAPFKAPEGEKFGVADPPKGQRRCIVVAPKKVAAGQPWSWNGCYWDHQPQTEVELLRRGFHVAYISANATLKPGKEWDAWYAFLTEQHGLSKKPAFIGMSRGGEYEYTWAADHPQSVSCIYADNPGGNPDFLLKIGVLARQDVPVLHVCGSIDPSLEKFSGAIEEIYHALGGRISVMIKEGQGHHPHSLRDPMPIADFIERSVAEEPMGPAQYLGEKVIKDNFYSLANSYQQFPKEGTHITCRGPLFSECYNRYTFQLPGVEGPITVIMPNPIPVFERKKIAPKTPWVLRCGVVTHDAQIDLELLKKGFHIVVGPVPYNADGPKMDQWDIVYKHLIEHDFDSAERPALEGAGAAAGEVYAWAIRNPNKVSCIYAENPILRSASAGTSGEITLARSGVPLLVVAGALDPALNDNTRALEKRFNDLDGRVEVITIEGKGHFIQPPVEKVVEFITHHTGEAPLPR